MDELMRFRREVSSMETADIMLILEDQRDLYSYDEIRILEEEFSKRPTSDIAASKERIACMYEEDFEKREKIRKQKKLVQLKAIKDNKIRLLAQNGYDSYYEYTALTITDDRKGAFDVDDVMSQINEMALNGWRLKTAVTNELGKNSVQFGLGGFSTGTNATIDQTVFIFERKINILRQW